MPSILDLTEAQYDRLYKLADMLAESDVYSTYSIASKTKRLSPDELVFKMLRGLELGIQPIAALTALYNEHGILTMHAETAMGLLFATGDIEDYHMDSSETECVIRIKRRGWTETSVFRYTVENASAEGLLGTAGNWKIRQKVMLQHRCESLTRRAVGPEVGLGVVYVTGELSGGEFYKVGGEVDRIYGTGEFVEEGKPAPKKDKVIKLPEPQKAPEPVKEDAFGSGFAGSVEPPEEETAVPSDTEIDAALEKAAAPTKEDFGEFWNKAKEETGLDGKELRGVVESLGVKIEWTVENDPVLRHAIVGYINELKLSRMPSGHVQNGSKPKEAVSEVPVKKADFNPDDLYIDDDEDEDDSPKIKMESKAVAK